MTRRTVVSDAAAELTTLWPALAAALERDTTPAQGSTQGASSVVNPDVLHAMLTLKREIPAACLLACQATGEPWTVRDLAGCLTTLPRLAARLHDLGHAGAVADLGDAARHWVRVTKTALGLRTPDIPVGYECPWDHDPVMLLVQGSEAFLHPARDGVTIEWRHPARIYCPHVCQAHQEDRRAGECGDPPCCGAVWVSSREWLRLGLLLRVPGVAVTA